MIGWITSGVIVVSVLVLPSHVLALLVPIGIVIGISCGVMATLASFAAIRMAHRETRAGYTTIYGRGLSLWQLDGVTGEVLRRPGEPPVHRRRGRG